MSKPTQSEKIIEALLDTFDRDTLAEIVLRDLNKKLLDFAPFRELLTIMLKNAEQEEWLEPLIEAVLKEKPDDYALKQIALLDPLQSLITKPAQKSNANGDEVARGVNALLQVLNQVPAQMMSAELFTELNSKLGDLYTEFKLQATVIAP